MPHEVSQGLSILFPGDHGRGEPHVDKVEDVLRPSPISIIWNMGSGREAAFAKEAKND